MFKVGYSYEIDSTIYMYFSNYILDTGYLKLQKQQ